jgi:cytochrome c556
VAGYDLSVDMESLRTLATDLASIVDELENADDNASDAAEATGHDELRERVNDFADKWRIKREEMIGDVKKLSEIMTQIVDTFTEVDAELAKALEDSAEKAK